MAEFTWVDYLLMVIYFVFVLGIGWLIKRRTKTSEDFFLSGRSLPAWVTGLAFISANLGAQEVIGMGASGAKYGIATSHFYWVGAVPAMCFVAVFMMPFYYGSRARSVPEYLKLRFDEKTRALNAFTFAGMTVLSSGISMYAMAMLFERLLGWNFHFSLVLSAVVVLGYILFGGLTSAIYNEVLQFFLIVFGFLPLVLLGLKDVGWWSGLVAKLRPVAESQGLSSTAYTESWRHMGDAAANPMGVEVFGLAMGLGFVLSFGYWCTDFLVVQRAMAADSMSAARRTPLIAALPKMVFPFLVIVPGMIALVATPPPAAGPQAAAQASGGQPVADAALAQGVIPAQKDAVTGQPVRDRQGNLVPDYNFATPAAVLRYFPTGLLGLGITALLASFMSGMAGNVTAFNTVCTYDIYQSYIKKDASDAHYLWVGRVATVGGVLLSLAAAYVASKFNNIMDVLQLVFAFVNAPLFAAFGLGMFWRRTTGHGAFAGLLCGTIAAAVHHGLSLPGEEHWGVKGGYLAIPFGAQAWHYRSEMAQTFYTAIWAFGTAAAVTVAVSLLTRARPADELRGLVYSLTPKPDDHAKRWWARPGPLAVGVLVLTALLNLVFF
ncbi:MAG TPA: sodium:solute symporter family protein [Humisphaera sp.]